MRASKARAGLRAGQTRHRRWNAYGKHLPFGPEVGAVCGKAACTDLCGGGEVTRVPTATMGTYRPAGLTQLIAAILGSKSLNKFRSGLRVLATASQIRQHSRSGL